MMRWYILIPDIQVQLNDATHPWITRTKDMNAEQSFCEAKLSSCCPPNTILPKTQIAVPLYPTTRPHMVFNLLFIQDMPKSLF